jgi:hypothetical protein
MRAGCLRVVNPNQNSGSRGGFGVVAWRVYEKRGCLVLFPSSWFLLINFNDGIFLWEIAVRCLLLLWAWDGSGCAVALLLSVFGLGVALMSPVEEVQAAGNPCPWIPVVGLFM